MILQRLLPLAIGWLALLPACGGSFRERFRTHGLPKLRACAAFDFSCPGSQLELQSLGTLAPQSVSGCGRKATYAQGRNGVWLLNADSTSEKTSTGKRGARLRPPSLSHRFEACFTQ